MTIHYHGTPITGLAALAELAGRCFCVSYARPEQAQRAHELGQSVMLDNGAFSFWQQRRAGTITEAPDWSGYHAWCDRWLERQTTWAVIPDVIDGTEEENDRLIAAWPHGRRGAPVWHLHESLDRLVALARTWPLVCLGSSGAYAELGTRQWHRRMEQAFNLLCPSGLPITRLHMLRGMAQVAGPYPFFSLDSSDVAQNHHRDGRPGERARRWDSTQCPPRWEPREQLSIEAA